MNNRNDSSVKSFGSEAMSTTWKVIAARLERFEVPTTTIIEGRVRAANGGTTCAISVAVDGSLHTCMDTGMSGNFRLSIPACNSIRLVITCPGHLPRIVHISQGSAQASPVQRISSRFLLTPVNQPLHLAHQRVRIGHPGGQSIEQYDRARMLSPGSSGHRLEYRSL